MKPVHILIYGLNYAPELIGIGKYTGEMAVWLAERGHEVQVVTAPPYYPAWRIEKGYSGGRYTSGVEAGVRVVRCPIWIPGRVTLLTRLLYLLSFALSSAPALLWTALRRRPEVIVVIAPALFCAPLGWLAARLVGARSWLHVQDFEVDAGFGLGILSGRALRTLVLRAERILMRGFDRVSTITEHMRRRLLDKGTDPDRTYLFPNWVDVEKIRPLAHESPYRAELGIPSGACVALYSGNMGEKQGIEDLGEIAARLAGRKDLVFVFGGAGVRRQALVEACAGLPNVRFIDLQPTERLNDLLNLADIHLLPQRAEAADLLMPCKLTGMLASGRAVVATAHAGTAVADSVTGHGLVTPPGALDAFAGAVERLAGDSALRAEMGSAGRAYAARTLSKTELLKTFEADLWAWDGAPLQTRAADRL